MKKLWVCVLVAGTLAITGCGMSAKERIALQEAEYRTTQLKMQQQREWAEQQRLSQLTPEQRHEEDLAKTKKEQEEARAWGNAGRVVLCAWFGC